MMMMMINLKQLSWHRHLPPGCLLDCPVAELLIDQLVAHAVLACCLLHHDTSKDVQQGRRGYGALLEGPQEV